MFSSNIHPIGQNVKDEIKERVQILKHSMAELARPTFAESELEDLWVLIRLTLEFEGFLHGSNCHFGGVAEKISRPRGSDDQINFDRGELRYAVESIFSGVGSFMIASSTYRMLTGSTASEIEWGTTSFLSLAQLFCSTLSALNVEKDFVRKFRLLLDLFKIQIVFAGTQCDVERF
jgi:hypothetical protein